jgi:hypothetical protein
VKPGNGRVTQRRARPRPYDCTLPAVASESSALHGARARSQSERERRARPRFAVGEEGKHRRVLIFDRRREHDERAGAKWRERKASRRRVHVRKGFELGAKPPDFDAQSRAMRFVGVLRPKGASEQRAPRNIRAPRFAQCANEREQDRPRGERDRGVGVAHGLAATVDDKRPRSEQRFDLLEEEGPFRAGRNQARGGRV